MAILPVRLCRIFRRSFFFPFPFGKCPLALIAFIILLNHRQQTPCQRLIYKLWNLGGVTPTVELLRKYADYFDVSMDYIFARCDEPQGKLYQAKPPVGEGNPELAQFVEMCFDPSSPMNDKLKKTLIQMLGEAKT